MHLADANIVAVLMLFSSDSWTSRRTQQREHHSTLGAYNTACMKPGQHSQAVVDVVMLQPQIFLPQHHSSTLLLATHNIINCQLDALLLPLLLVALLNGRQRWEMVAAMDRSVNLKR
jgi:hypothetical protein